MSTVEKISRQRATQIIDFTFEDFKKRINFDSISKEVNCSNFEEYLSFGLKLVNNYNDETRLAINLLDTPDFIEFYKQVGKFAEAYAIGTKDNFKAEMPITLEELPYIITENSIDSKEKIEILNGFTAKELQNSDIKTETKLEFISKMLEDLSVFNNNGNGAVKMLTSFKQEESVAFINKCSAEPVLLEKFINKLGGKERKQALLLLDNICSAYKGNKKTADYKIEDGLEYNVKFKNGEVKLETFTRKTFHDESFERLNDKKINLDPYTLVAVRYRGEEEVIPALALLSEDVIFKNHYKENVDLNSLSKEEKEALFNEFVMYFLGEAFANNFALNPVETVESIVLLTAISCMLSMATEAVTIGFAIASSIVGVISTGKNFISGLRMLEPAKKQAENSKNIHQFKEAALNMAEVCLKIGTDGLMLLVALIQFGQAVYKGIKYTYKNKKVSVENENGSKSEKTGEKSAGNKKKHTKTDAEPGSPEHKAIRWKDYKENGGKLDYEAWSKKYDTVIANKKKGLEFEKNCFEQFSKKYKNAQTQVEVEFALDDGEIITLKLDAIGLDQNNNIIIQEYKSSATASFTNNQKIIFHDNNDIIISNGVVKNPNCYIKKIPKGTKVKIITPEI